MPRSCLRTLQFHRKERVRLGSVVGCCHPHLSTVSDWCDAFLPKFILSWLLVWAFLPFFLQILPGSRGYWEWIVNWARHGHHLRCQLNSSGDSGLMMRSQLTCGQLSHKYFASYHHLTIYLQHRKLCHTITSSPDGFLNGKCNSKNLRYIWCITMRILNPLWSNVCHAFQFLVK